MMVLWCVLGGFMMDLWRSSVFQQPRLIMVSIVIGNQSWLIAVNMWLINLEVVVSSGWYWLMVDGG